MMAMVATPTREPGSDEGWRVIEAAVAAAHHRLGEGLASAYAIGSLAHGGFSPAASDVDLALLTTADCAIEMASVADAIGGEVRARVSGELAERLSVFHVPWPEFRSPPPGSRFPVIDRQDLVGCGLLVHGEDLRARFAALADPTPARRRHSHRDRQPRRRRALPRDPTRYPRRLGRARADLARHRTRGRP